MGLRGRGSLPSARRVCGLSDLPVAEGAVVTPSKAKGTRAETMLVRYLRDRGFPYAERRALTGARDLGDITGTPGVVWEVKAGTRLLIPEWLRQTEVERNNAKADMGVLVVKPKGLGDANVGQWWAIKPLFLEAELLKLAGY